MWLEENLTLQEFYLKNNLIQKLLELDNALHRKLFTICRKDLIYRMSQGLSIHYDRVRNMEATAIHGHKTCLLYTSSLSRRPSAFISTSMVRLSYGA